MLEGKGFKIVELNGKNYKLTFPTIGQATSGDIAYSKAFISAIKDGILPRVALEKQLRESGAWSDVEDNKIRELSLKLQDVMAKLLSESEKENKIPLRQEIEVIKNELIVLNMQKQSMFMHTAEAKGEEAKISFIAWQCILNEDGSKIWNSKDEFMNELNDENISKLLQEYILYTSKVDDKINSINELLEDDEDDIEEEIKVEETKEEVKEEAVQA